MTARLRLVQNDIPAPPALRDCPVCNSSTATALPDYSPEHWKLCRCGGCDLVYLRNPAAYAALKQDLAWEKTFAEKKTATAGSTRFSPHVRALRKRLGMTRDKTAAFRRWFNEGHVLDIGCGLGRRIQPPMTPYGIELSTAQHRLADRAMRPLGGYCIHGAGAEAIWKFDARQFDGIVMFSYLEHETNVMSVLRGAHRALKDRGCVFIRVPNFGSLNRRVIGPNWCGFRYPDHVNYFTLATLSATARRVGFTAALVNRLTLPLDDNISVLLRKSPEVLH
ncbi:MAG: SAM-dependent methyltransferase [Sulfitobacter sp.]|jgi:SAM-dependent methyltransferase